MIRYHIEIAQLIAKNIPAESGMDSNQILSLLERPQRSDHGDIAFPCFQLAKTLKKAPPAISQELATRLQGISPNFETIVNLGPYLNIKLSAAAAHIFCAEALQKGPSFGLAKAPKNKTILIEYGSPNVAKELHIGHFRNTMLGQTLNNIYRATGHNVIAINHLGDWGSQFGKVAYGFLHWGEEEELAKSPIAYLTKLYVRFSDEEEKNPSLTKEARLLSKKIEDNDPELRALWKKFCTLSIENLHRIYGRLHVKFDHFLGESFYYDKTDSLVKNLREKNLLVLSEGAEVVNLEDYKMPPCLIITGDGTTLYATRDLAAAIYRQNTFQPNEVLYVVGSEQQLHFKQVFKVLELMGFPWAEKLQHVYYGMYRFKDGKFSTRKGRVILLEDVINEARDKVLEIINEKNPNLQNKLEVAETVGLGAVIFNDLSTDRIKDVEFDWHSVLDFEGDTGPYIQYSYARACSILRQAETKGISPNKEISLKHCNALETPHALALMKHFGRFELTLEAAARHQKPSFVANYALELAKLFNAFYRNIKVLDSEASENDTKAKIALVFAAKQVLENSLAILCIQSPEAM